ncbi:hypothetical protein MHC_00710 [Mycoplasma haemocanis str. Illinois]|uniref:Uncharacterized protein n=1 Tax=Mycoplasma haemocanis (strain Illinois) TaxID=1111676 RepID=H6N5P8_MYCHN|nr:hypothetical protein [Mycoplasma haemocanis]AEW45008.1 hypothetical protein MHC_00710 [Mycoplasma haemocanis str. Illinois]
MSLSSVSKKLIPVIAGASGIVGFTLFKGSASEGKANTSTSNTLVKNEHKSIGDAIKAANKKLLSSSSAGEAWEAKKRQYEDKFKHWITKEGLKDWCTESLSNDYQENLFDDVSKLCSVPNIKEIFSMKNKEIIDVTNSNDRRWATKVSDYGGKNRDKKMPNSELKNADKGVTPEVIMNWCKGELEKEFINENDRYRLVETWCVA